MAEKINLWCGFSTVLFRKKDADGGFSTVLLTGRGDPREKPEHAWEDALREESSHQEFLKKDGMHAIDVVTGICPAHFAF